MRHVYGLALAVLGCVLGLGCERAGRYPGPHATRDDALTAVPPPIPVPQPVLPPPATTPPAKTVNPENVWKEADVTWLEPPVPIRYVSADADRDEWNKLTDFWTVVEEARPGMTPNEAAALFGAAPWNLAPLAAQVKRVVKVKLPLGLPDPRAATPASNPPTLGKWQLGKQLFFDKELFLQAADAPKKQACASCHDPAKGFSDGKVAVGAGAFATPRLVNTAYYDRYFWDGRAGSLEEAVQSSISETADSDAPHHWPGAVERLQRDTHYTHDFLKAFGTPPTEDAVAKALATYLRSIVSGNALQDRAERGRKGKDIDVMDYEAVLDDAALKKLQPAEGTKKEIAQQLRQGYTLYQAHCAVCHPAGAYTDRGFHNIGIGDSSKDWAPGQEHGRFATLPVGLKDRRMIGAYKTPSLRSLPRGGPFFHDGLRINMNKEDPNDALQQVVQHYFQVGKTKGKYIDPAIQALDLKNEDIHALVLFLKALDGDPVPALVADPGVAAKK